MRGKLSLDPSDLHTSVKLLTESFTVGPFPRAQGAVYETVAYTKAILKAANPRCADETDSAVKDERTSNLFENTVRDRFDISTLLNSPRQGDVSDQNARGALLALLGMLRNSTVLPAVPALVSASLAEHRRRIPQQVASQSIDTTFAEWISASSVAELLGEYSLALAINLEVLRVVSAANGDRESHELASVCWARCGRIHRQLGELEAASDCYAQAITLSKRGNEGWCHATLGQAVLASNRGNQPEVALHARAILRVRKQVAPQFVLAAHQLLSIVERKLGNFERALIHGWNAYDLLSRESVIRFEILVVQGDVAAELSDDFAACAAYEQVLDECDVPRIRVQALISLSRVVCRRAAGKWSSVRARAYARAVRRRALDQLANAVTPHDRIALQLSIAELSVTVARFRDATTRFEIVRLDSESAGFYELEFRASEALKAMERGATTNANPSTTPAVVSRAQDRIRSPELDRMFDSPSGVRIVVHLA